MALNTLKNIKEVNGEKIVIMDDLINKYPEKFNESGEMDYAWFESEIRPNAFIYIRHDKNSISFTLQNGPIKELGKNGCQVVDMIAISKIIIEKLNEQYPCRENSMTITHLDEALMWQEKRTKDRVERQVEGKSEL